MKLFARPASPFARKARICAIETGQEAALEVEMLAEPSDVAKVVPAFNPLVKVPALVLDDGRVLYDSRVICEYIDAQHAGPSLFPLRGPERWEALRLQALGDGIADATVLFALEGMRPEAKRSPDWEARQRTKMMNGLGALEADEKQLGGPLTIGQIAVACAIGYLEFRLPEFGWRADHPRLSAWYLDFCGRDSMKRTHFAMPKAA